MIFFCLHNLPAFMASNPIKDASESDVTSAAKETLDFDEDTFKR